MTRWERNWPHSLGMEVFKDDMVYSVVLPTCNRKMCIEQKDMDPLRNTPAVTQMQVIAKIISKDFLKNVISKLSKVQ